MSTRALGLFAKGLRQSASPFARASQSSSFSTIANRSRNIWRIAKPNPVNVRPGCGRRGFRLSSWLGSGEAAPAQKSLSMAERMRKLSREYGYSALGVYLALSVLDFPFCFLFVRMVGVDTIGYYEHQLTSTIKSVIPENVRDTFHYYWSSIRRAEKKERGNDDITEKVEMASWNVEEASDANKEDASIWTQLAFAYAIHKSFVFLRVPLTAAVTPKVVKTLRSWGWNIGKRKPQ